MALSDMLRLRKAEACGAFTGPYRHAVRPHHYRFGVSEALLTLCRRVDEGQGGRARTLDGDHQDEALGGRVPPRERAPSILARDSIDHGEVRIGALLDDPAADLPFLIGVICRDDGQSDPRITLGVLGLERVCIRAHEDGVALEVDPYRIDLR